MKRTLVLTERRTKLIIKIMRWHECPCSSNKHKPKKLSFIQISNLEKLKSATLSLTRRCFGNTSNEN